MTTTPILDYHTHTNFSTDGSSSMGEMIANAVKTGIAEIAITDHYDPDYPEPGWGEGFSQIEYTDQLGQCKSKYRNEIQVVKGIEIGIQHGGTLQKCKDAANFYDYDFIIGSFHCAQGYELAMGGFFDNRSVEDATEAFYRYNYDCLSVYKDYDVLGHINVIDRYGAYIPKYNNLWDVVEEILKMIIYDGKGIEINTSSFRYGMGEYTTPSHEILRLYKDLGGEIITVGSDAHRIKDLGYKIAWAYEKMKSVGFKYVTTYRQRKPSFIKL